MQLLASGRDADVFALDSSRVLRRYRDGRSMAWEATVMRHALAAGYPVPVVHETTPDGMILERLYGPTMLGALADGSMPEADGGALLGSLLLRLAPIAAGPAGPSGQLLHLDLHPGNVVLTDRGPVVIDWSNAAGGPSTLDIAMSGLIMAEVAVGSIAEVPVTAAAVRSVLDAMLTVTGPVDPVQLEVAVEHRRHNPTLSPAEKSNLPTAAALLSP